MCSLRPSKQLLDNDFSGYKLSLDLMPVYKLELLQSVDVVDPNEEQYSFLHQREFSLHNHLHCDSWDSLNVYFVQKNWKVEKIDVNSVTGRLNSLKEVFQIPMCERIGGEFNVSLTFPSENLVLIGDGARALHIVDTSSRSQQILQNETWKVVHSEEIFGEQRPFHIIDSRFSPEKNSLHCLILHVELKGQEKFDADKKENKNTSKYETVLHWLTFEQNVEVEGKWKLVRSIELRGKGSLEYAALEVSGEAVYVASIDKFKFPDLEDHAKENGCAADNGSSVDYEWGQDLDSMKLLFSGLTSLEEVSVNSEGQSLTVKHKEEILLAGSLQHPINSDIKCHIHESTLVVVLEKTEKGLMWQYLIKESSGGKNYIGKEIINQPLSQEISGRLAHLTSENVVEPSGVINDWQMEDCDAFEEDSRTLYRFTAGNAEPTHKVDIGGSQWLFTTRVGGQEVPAACIRSDVDGCVWLPSPPEESGWQVSHLGTFHAFGYILASKVTRKFTISPPDLSYVSVVDQTGHVIIYKRGVSVRGELRNRKTGRQVESIATQSMINLKTKDTILGAAASPNYLFILTSNSVHIIHVL